MNRNLNIGGQTVLPIRVTVLWHLKVLYAIGVLFFLSLGILSWVSSHSLTILLFFGAFTLLIAYTLLLSFTTIEADSEALQVRAPHGLYCIKWAEVQRVETNRDSRDQSGQVFAFRGQDKSLSVNLSLAGRGKKELLGFIEYQICYYNFQVTLLSADSLKQKNTRIRRFGFW